MPHIVRIVSALIGAVIVVMFQPFASAASAASTAPWLALDPTEARAPVQVTATGGCDPSAGSVYVAFDGVDVGSGSVDSSTGDFSVPFTVPAGTAPGSHKVATDCGGSAPFVVDPPLATTTPPTTTPTSATTSAGTTPTGATPTGRTPTRTTRGSASPRTTTRTSTSAASGAGHVPPGGASPAGRGSPPGSPPPISAPGGPPAPAGSSRLTWPIAGLLAAAALFATAVKPVRDRRGRRWVTDHVELRPAISEVLVPDKGREQEVRSASVRLHMHEESGWTTGLEVKDADHRADPADDGP